MLKELNYSMNLHVISAKNALGILLLITSFQFTETICKNLNFHFSKNIENQMVFFSDHALYSH